MKMEMTQAIADVLQEQEVKGAKVAFDAAVRDKKEAQLAAENNELIQKRQDEQNEFVEELSPLINFIRRLEARDLLPELYFDIDIGKDKVSVNTGLILGIQYRVYDDPDDQYGYSGYRHLSRSRDKYDSYEDREKKRIRAIKDKITLRCKTVEVKQGVQEDKQAHFTTCFEPCDHVDDIETGGYGCSIPSSLDTVFFLGKTFKRGETSIAQVNELAVTLVHKLYEMNHSDPAKQKNLRDVIKECFGLDADALHEITAMTVIAKEFKTLGNKDINLPPPPVPFDYQSIVQMSRKDVSDDIKAALALSSDPLAILNIGETAVNAAHEITLQVAETVLPLSLPEELRIIQTLKDDIADLSPKPRDLKKQSLGGAVLKRVVGHAKETAFTKAGDKGDALSANFGLMAATLNHSKETMARRIGVIRQQSQMVGTLKTILDEYQKRMPLEAPRSTEDPVVLESYQQRQETIIQNAKHMFELKTELNDILKAEVQAYVAVMRACDTVPLIAMNLIKAIGHLAKQSSEKTLLNANEALGMLRDSDPTIEIARPDQQAWNNLKMVFDGALNAFTDLEKELGVSLDSSKAASQKRQSVPRIAKKQKIVMTGA